MKTILRVPVLALFLAATPAWAIVGYVNHGMMVGDNLFSNPLIPSNGDEHLSNMLIVPEGTVVSLWNPISATFDTSSEFLGGQWTIDYVLARGTGARLTTETAFTATFVGEVGSRDGSPFNPDSPFAYPPPFSGPNGIYLLGDKIPIGGGDVFMRIIGRNPNEGEQVALENGDVFTYSSFSSTGWIDKFGQEVAQPTLGPTYAAFFNIGPVPEPSTATLGLLGVALMAFRRRA